MSVGPRLRRTTYVARYGKRSLWATPASGSVLHSLWNRATHAWSRSDCDGWGGEGHAARTETVVVRDRDRHEGGADMTRIIGAPRSRRRTWLFLSTVAAALAVAVLFIPSALAVHDEAFQLDGDPFAATTTNHGGTQNYDWDSFFNGSGAGGTIASKGTLPTGGFASGVGVKDLNTTTKGGSTVFDPSDSSTFTVASKDIKDVADWTCTPANNVTDKGDIMNAYAVTYTDAGGDQFLYFGLERSANTGDANVGFWFLQGGAGCSSTGGSFTGHHQDGDIFVVSAFTKGGNVSTITAYRWTGGASGGIDPTPVATGVDCTSSLTPLGGSPCATSNTAAKTAWPWLTYNKTNALGHTVDTGEFFEGGLNLTDSGLGGECLNTFLANTRSSQELTATLYDYALGTLGECKSSIVTTPKAGDGTSPPPTSIPPGGSVQVKDSANLTVTGPTTWSGTVKFFLCGPIATGNCSSGGTQVGAAAGIPVDQTTTNPILSDAATISVAGRYCWRAKFTAISPADLPPASDPEADSTSTSECFHLSASPTIDTNQTPKTGNVGDPISDSASLHNTSNLDGTGTVKIYLYLPGQTCAADGSGGSLEATYTGVTTNGPFTAGPVTATQAGVYHWLAIFSGDTNNAGPVNSGCANEPVTITAHPTITTTANPASGTAPVALNDSATLHNTSNLLGGTITFYLFAPGVACNTSGTGALFNQTVSVTAGNEGPYNTSGGPSVSTAGTYQWVAIYSGDANNAATDSGCGTEPVVDTTPGQGC